MESGSCRTCLANEVAEERRAWGTAACGSISVTSKLNTEIETIVVVIYKAGRHLKLHCLADCLFVNLFDVAENVSSREGGVAMNPGDERYGDIHFYNEYKDLWADETYMIPRCSSEYGVQSFPRK